MDGARDVLLSLISIWAAILELIFSPYNLDIYFNRLMEFGRKTDVWITLFGASNYDQNSEARDSNDIDSKDKARENMKNIPSHAYVKKLENLLIAEYNKGGRIQDLKEGTDTLLEKLRKNWRIWSRIKF